MSIDIHSDMGRRPWTSHVKDGVGSETPALPPRPLSRVGAGGSRNQKKRRQESTPCSNAFCHYVLGFGLGSIPNSPAGVGTCGSTGLKPCGKMSSFWLPAHLAKRGEPNAKLLVICASVYIFTSVPSFPGQHWSLGMLHRQAPPARAFSPVCLPMSPPESLGWLGKGCDILQQVQDDYPTIYRT